MLNRLTRSGADSAQGATDGAGDPVANTDALREQVAHVLDALQANGWLSEQRAAQSLVQAKSARFGNLRLRQMMQARSLDADAASAALHEVAASEFERALLVWQRRFGSPAADLRERARQHRFLAARGFQAQVIERVLKGERPDGSEH